MAKIHFVKNGRTPSGERFTRTSNVSLGNVTKFLNQFECKRSDKPPTFNPTVPASNYSQFQFVVLEVDDDEICPSFPIAGFYYFVGLEPVTCQEALRLSGSLT